MIACARFANLKSPLACLVLWSATAAAQDALLIRTNYYPVTGATLPELHRSLEQRRPRGTSGRHDGFTVWKVDWNAAIQQHGQVNRPGAFTTRTTITITLPRWAPSTHAAPGLVKTWNDYMAKLDEHEQGHVQLVRAAVSDMHTRVESVAPGSDARAVRQQIDALAREILAICTRKNQEYDQRTRHGATQGAMLPSGYRHRDKTLPREPLTK